MWGIFFVLTPPFGHPSDKRGIVFFSYLVVGKTTENSPRDRGEAIGRGEILSNAESYPFMLRM